MGAVDRGSRPELV